MLFTSFDFLAFFGALIGLLVLFRSSRARFLIVLLASYVFYAAWDWRFLSLLLACSFWNYGLALAIDKAKSDAGRKAAMVVAVVLNLAALVYFKYANFFLDSFTALFGLQSPGALKIILPLGISFFTFQGVSYVVDVYRRVHPPEKDLLVFLLFKAFFPQLIAGPIVRAHEFMPQLERPFRFKKQMIKTGLQYFLFGCLTKLVFADNFAVMADQVFANPAMYDVPTHWIALLSYTGQIYCDFFGYSMMAIGLARILGYRLPLNFRMPYVSSSIQDFWRRWHITLSNWLRDYLYIAFGGNRRGKLMTNVNLMLTMLIGGLWHGASWNFVLWGGLQGGALILNRFYPRPLLGGSLFGKGLGWSLTFLFVALAWVPFRASDLSTTADYFKGLTGFSDGAAQWFYMPSLVLLGLLGVWHCGYLYSGRFRRGQMAFRRLGLRAWLGLAAALLAILFYAPMGQTPFIYFQF
jgi:alginate O-acetyltransferase complex protein AlgI